MRACKEISLSASSSLFSWIPLWSSSIASFFIAIIIFNYLLLHLWSEIHLSLHLWYKFSFLISISSFLNPSLDSTILLYQLFLVVLFNSSSLTISYPLAIVNAWDKDLGLLIYLIALISLLNPPNEASNKVWLMQYWIILNHPWMKVFNAFLILKNCIHLF